MNTTNTIAKQVQKNKVQSTEDLQREVAEAKATGMTRHGSFENFAAHLKKLSNAG